MRRCTNCREPAKVVRQDYEFAESGLSNLVLKNIEVVTCTNCGEVAPRIPRISELMCTLALALITKPYDLSGEEIRFLRKYSGTTAAEFAELLSADPSTLSRWENDAQRPGPQSDKLIRVIALARGEGLKAKLELIVDAFKNIKKPSKRVRLSVNPETGKVDYKEAA
jgi:putative zinc finger/helix-turn-helix YgiT family protein